MDLPADFRLVGATTRTPEEIPPAIRSRCMEIFFRPLLPEEIGEIAVNAFERSAFPTSPEAVEVVKKYAKNGREAVNMVQLAGGIAMTENRDEITAADIEWVVNSSQISPRPEKKIPCKPAVRARQRTCRIRSESWAHCLRLK